ncbi:MAG TPA: endonuclease/exonuclease/phosphatase family protein [Pilimelia sp.]|nr:endonuclease/exonuclease/phosphatase family protein [Pilimelia sp.]
MGKATVAERPATAGPTPAAPRRRWRRWPARLLLAAGVGWLALVVLHLILSGTAYWWGPIDLMPPLAFAAVPVLLLLVAAAARSVRWRVAVVSVAALALGAECTGLNLATLWHTPPPAAGAITVVTWNTEYWDQDLQPGGPHSTADFYAFLRAMDADVYLLQEYAHVDVTREDTFSQALEIDQEAQLRAAFPGYEIVLAGRDLTLSRLPVVGHRWLDSTPWLPADLRAVPPGLRDRPLFYQSQTLRTDIRVHGRVVSFYNSHLYQPPQRIFRLRGDPGQSMFSIDRFNAEMRLAGYAAIAADMAGNPLPIVFAGDLNTSPAMGIRRLVPDRLVDQTRVLSSLYPASWPASSPKWRLDWLFTTPDVAVSRYELLDTAGFSDHKIQRVALSAN